MWTALLTMTLKNVSIKVRKTENQINELTNSESHNIQKKKSKLLQKRLEKYHSWAILSIYTASFRTLSNCLYSSI